MKGRNGKYQVHGHPDLEYVNPHIFYDGQKGFREDKMNPYPTSARQKRDDWYAGYLFAYRQSKDN